MDVQTMLNYLTPETMAVMAVDLEMQMDDTELGPRSQSVDSIYRAIYRAILTAADANCGESEFFSMLADERYRQGIQLA